MAIAIAGYAAAVAAAAAAAAARSVVVVELLGLLSLGSLLVSGSGGSAGGVAWELGALSQCFR